MSPFQLIRLCKLVACFVVIAIIGLWRDPLPMLVILAIPTSLYLFLTWLSSPKKAPSRDDQSYWRP